MRIRIAGVGVRCAAGNMAQLRDAIQGQRACFTHEPPYPSVGLSQPSCGRISELLRDRPAESLLLQVLTEALEASDLDRDVRIGLIVGTSSGHISGPWERWHRAHLEGESVSEAGTGRAEATRSVAEQLALQGPVATLSTACVSGTSVLAIAESWLRSGRADAVVAAGVDALSLFIHAGFAGLGALSASTPAPFSASRDGLLPGEGAAALVLVAESGEARGPGPWLRGTAILGEAHHITAPHPDGIGAGRCMMRALQRAGLSANDLDALSVHGTGTPFNDPMELSAIESVFGSRPLAIHGIKHLVGHTMGAAGAIEAAVLVDMLRSGEVPPPYTPPLDATDDTPARIRAREPESRVEPTHALSLSAAFGGLYSAAVLSSSPPPDRAETRCQAVEIARASVEFAASESLRPRWPDAPALFSRSNRYTQAGLLVLHRLMAQASIPPDAALVLASETGCRAADLEYHEGVVRNGAAQASRRLFTRTLPGAPIADASILFGLTGPQLAFIGPAEIAETHARLWVEQGRSPAAISLSCEVPEPSGWGRAEARLWAPR